MLCQSNGETCKESTDLYGLAYQPTGTSLIRDTRTLELNTEVTVHEFGHFYGAQDHYGGDNPTTLEMNGGSEDGPYSKYCIYGEEFYLDNEIFICDGCRATIYANRDDYDHS